MSFFSRLLGDDKPQATRTDITLKDLLPGDMVDYDMTTWQVRAKNKYDYSEFETVEWQLDSAGTIRYLELEIDDEDYWSLTETIPFATLGKAQCDAIKAAVAENGDPPDELTYKNMRYYMEEMAGGHFLKDGVGERQPFLQWHYVSDDGATFLIIEQWGDDDFEAGVGSEVHDWQFTNLLPGSAGQ